MTPRPPCARSRVPLSLPVALLIIGALLAPELALGQGGAPPSFVPLDSSVTSASGAAATPLSSISCFQSWMG